MLLKVFDGEDGWVLFDDVDEVHLTAKNHEVSQQNELNMLAGADALVLVPKGCFNGGKKVPIGVIEFERKGTKREVLFTNIVYVCDNRGNTIDRLRA
jgi:hypothetical protein